MQQGSMLISMMTCLICCGSTQTVILPPIYGDGHSLKCVDTQKYLDLHVDYERSWRSHVASMCKKMAYY